MSKSTTENYVAIRINYSFNVVLPLKDALELIRCINISTAVTPDMFHSNSNIKIDLNEKLELTTLSVTAAQYQQAMAEALLLQENKSEENNDENE